MRTDLLLCVFLLSTLTMSCTNAAPSAAAQYKEKLKNGDANADSSPSDEKTTDESTSDEETTDESTSDEETTSEGDVAAGNKLLTTCGGCHPANGVTLNKASVSKLDDAYTGAQKQTHGGFTEAFVDKRADLEAAMNAK